MRGELRDEPAMSLRSVHTFYFKNGIKDVCISPGNRNTPLTLAMTNHPGILCTSHIDERSGGFFALGQSKVTKIPTVIITTSGTAATNLYLLFANFVPACLSLFMVMD